MEKTGHQLTSQTATRSRDERVNLCPLYRHDRREVMMCRRSTARGSPDACGGLDEEERTEKHSHRPEPPRRNFIARDGGAKARREDSPERSGRTLTERSHPEAVSERSETRLSDLYEGSTGEDQPTSQGIG